MASTGRSSSRSLGHTGSSTPWLAVRRISARSRGCCASRPGRWASTSASDWSANSGWRSQMSTIASIGWVSIQAASFSSVRARSARATGSSIPADAPTVTSPA